MWQLCKVIKYFTENPENGVAIYRKDEIKTKLVFRLHYNVRRKKVKCIS